MREHRHWITFIFSLPAVILSWLAFVVLCAGYVVHKPTFEPGFILSGQWRPWFGKIWRYSVGFGRVTIYKHYAISGSVKTVHKIRSHEHVHIRQTEDDMMKAFLVGAITGLWVWNIWVFLAIWSSGIVWLMVCYLTSMFRHGFKYNRIYRQAEHERAAYIETELDEDGRTRLEEYDEIDY